MAFLNKIKKLTNRILFFSLYFDLCLLEFFTRKYPYLFFLFTFFFGTFGYTENSSFFKFSCFFFSWFLMSISLTVLCLFNLSMTKNYFYDLLGKDFVIRKMGNPGLETFIKYWAPLLGGLAANEAGRLLDSWAIIKTAQVGLESTLQLVQSDPSLSADEKAAMTQQAFLTKNQMLLRAPEGTIDRIFKIDTYKNMMKTTIVEKVLEK